MIKTDNEKAVDQDYYWQPIESCPVGVKVQLLGRSGVAVYGHYHGGDWYIGWQALPKIPESMKGLVK